MPGMNLKFLNNPSQRIATGKSLPLKQLEAIVAYGTAEQRAKVVAKVLPQAYTLSVNKSTHHILVTILQHCDNLVRANLLYHLRRKINDMARSPCGNVLLQQMLEYLPNAQRKEIAESFVLNVDEDELESLCKHPFGNHVAQKLLEYPACTDVLMDHLVPKLRRLVVHPHGQRIVAKVIDCVADGAQTVVGALFPAGAATDDEMAALEDILSETSESLVISALLKHHAVDTTIKDGIIAALIEHAEEFTSLEAKKTTLSTSASATGYAEPDFISGGAAKGDADESKSASHRHNFAFAAAIEYGDDAQRKELFTALKDRLGQFLVTKGQVVIALAFFKFAESAVPEIRQEIIRALLGSAVDTPATGATPAKKGGRTPAKKKASEASSSSVDADAVVEVATHPVKTLVLRAIIEMDIAALGPAVDHLVAASKSLAVSPIGGPVLQRIVEFSSDAVRLALFKETKSIIPSLTQDPCGAFFVQSLLEYTSGTAKKGVVDAVSDTVTEDPLGALATAQGSRVVQKLVAYGSDATVKSIIDAILAGEEDEASDADDEEHEEEADESAAAAEQEGEDAKASLSRKEQREINRKKHYHIRDKRVLSYAVHGQACFAIQALLREAKNRQLNDHRKRLMNSLKPYVFDLAVSPWAGRVVLDVMLTAGSGELQAAIKNVVFMKAESWLSDVPAHAKGQAGMDPTMRGTLRRGREGNADAGKDLKKARQDDAATSAAASSSSEKKKPAKKLHRFLKR